MRINGRGHHVATGGVTGRGRADEGGGLLKVWVVEEMGRGAVGAFQLWLTLF